jgi:hypothetical protein
MNSEKLIAKVAIAAAVVLVPIATLSAGASAAPRHTARTQGGISIDLSPGVPNAWSSRLSGLPFGGAALYDGVVPYDGSAFYNGGAAPAETGQSVPTAWSSRLSGLPFGGAALDV